MFNKLVAPICLGLIFAAIPAAIGENYSPNYTDNFYAKSNKKAIDVEQISIGGIKLGMRERDFIKILGKPKSRTIKYDDVCYGSYITTWKYNNLEIEGLSSTNNPSQSQVHQIITSSSRYPTEKGVKVGDNISKAQKAYSNLLSKITRLKNEVLLAYSNDAYGGLVFTANKQNSIQQIRLIGASC
jgi:hypothetical protein